MKTLAINVAVHPWEILNEYMAWLWINQTKLAKLIGKRQVEVNYILSGTRDINTDRAIRLSMVFKTRPEFWLWMQHDYDIYLLSRSKKQEEYSEIANNLLNFWIA